MLMKVLKIFAIALVPTVIFAAVANANGGGAEPMPGTNFTDLPSYQPRPIEPLSRMKHVRKHFQKTYHSTDEH